MPVPVNLDQIYWRSLRLGKGCERSQQQLPVVVVANYQCLKGQVVVANHQCLKGQGHGLLGHQILDVSVCNNLAEHKVPHTSGKHQIQPADLSSEPPELDDTKE